MAIGKLDLLRRFAYYPASADGVKAEAHEEVREVCGKLALFLDGRVPDGREKSLAITALEEVMMWANAGIARHPES